MDGRWMGILLLALAAAAPAAEDETALLRQEGRRVAGQVLAQIRSELTRELERSGPVRAIVVCKYSVPEITSMQSRQSGARVTRVSLRARNPSLGGPDYWEQTVLMDFEKRLARGEKAEDMEFSQVTVEPQGRFFRYMKAIPMAPVCTACHGPAEAIPEAIKAQLAVDYPHDPATGFQPGQIRGAVTYKKAF